MGGPIECKHCGCGDIRSKTDSRIVFRCWSSYLPADDLWTVSNNCGSRCAVQLVELRERVQTAIGVLDNITSDAWEEGLLDATRILRGNSSKSSDSSPITADDLAASDYYEAVRQRVPWMTAVEHIEGLVEGYRQCGVMVWKAAEHIQRVYGGKHGQTD